MAKQKETAKNTSQLEPYWWRYLRRISLCHPTWQKSIIEPHIASPRMNPWPVTSHCTCQNHYFLKYIHQSCPTKIPMMPILVTNNSMQMQMKWIGILRFMQPKNTLPLLKWMQKQNL
jgi:hypothetical protein